MILGDDELALLARRFAGADTHALALTGSFARGDATAYSDVDLLRFVEVEPVSARERYSLNLVGRRLVSLTTTTVAAKRAELIQPDGPLFAVEGLRQARILADRDGALTVLVAEARAFTWTPELRKAAADHASDTLGGLAEEVHKLLGAFERDDESAMLYAALGIQQSVTRAAMVARGVLLRSENDYFAQALLLGEASSRWRQTLRQVIGYDALPGVASPAHERGEAALWLYVEAGRMLAGALTPTDAELVARASERIRQALG